MKLEKILDKLNTIEKTSFSKIIDGIISDRPKNLKLVDKILSSYSDTNLRNLDSHLFGKVFSLVESEYYDILSSRLDRSVNQLDILIDILIRDGNCIMSREWLGKLYEKEIRSIKSKSKSLNAELKEKDISEVKERARDYMIYRNCIEVAYTNDLKNNLDAKNTSDEKSILNALAKSLDLSQEEIKLLNYSVLPLKTLDLEGLIELLKSAGIVLYSKKNLTIYIPDEFVRLLRKYRGKEVADKYLKRVLRLIKDSEVNTIAKRHGVSRKLETREKLHQIIKEGIGIRNILIHDIHKEGTLVTAKKIRINNLVEKGLNITHLKGTNIDAKIDNLILFFNEIEREEKVGISIDGYQKLLNDLSETLNKTNRLIRNEFELQSEDVTSANLLLDFNIKPRDILEIISIEDLRKFCEKRDISTRGNEVLNILDGYKDTENIELESYVDIAYRNLINLKENGINIKEADLGNKFESLTRRIFGELGLVVDEELRKEVNTAKDKIDILIRVSEFEVILIECKSVKESGYNKFSSVSRQIKSYQNLLNSKNLRVVKSLLVAPDFSDDFINETNFDPELDLSLVKASSLIEILNSFKTNKKFKQFPYRLLLKDVMVHEEMVIKALSK